MKTLFTYLLLLVTISIYSAEKTAQDFDYGRIVNNTYYNSYFNMEVHLPKDWVLKSRNESKQLLDTGKELISEKNEELGELVELSEVNTAMLVTMFKYKEGAAVLFNPSFLIIGENLNSYQETYTETTYLTNAKLIMQQTGIYTNISDINTEKVGANEFYVMHGEANALGVSLKQSYYVTIRNNFALVFIISYADDVDKMTLLNSMSTLILK